MSEEKKQLCVNLYGGPCCGKSTLAADVFSKLKQRGVRAELVTEFAKDLVWENNRCALANQIYVFGNQYYRMHRINGMEVIVVDSPLLLTSVYDANKFGVLFEKLRDLAYESYCTFENMDYFIKRSDELFEEEGRVHKKDDSLILDDRIRDVLNEYKIKYHDVYWDSSELIASDVLMRLYGDGERKIC